jgi:histidine ammonia-lyase
MQIEISDKAISKEQIQAVINGQAEVTLSDSSRSKIRACRKYLDETVQKGDRLIYGVNTGFGSLCDVAVSKDEIEQLQYNLLVSHACGAGDEVPAEIVRLMLFLKVKSLSFGHSGVAEQTVDSLLTLLNKDYLPVVYELGSLGASGDLAPLAHLCLPLLGMGEVRHEGKKISGEQALKDTGLKPSQLQSKEGLALINGTQFMSAYGIYLIQEGERLSQLADLIASQSLEAFDCRIEPFDPLVHQIRPHAGQAETAANILRFREGSEIAQKEKQQVQDPYSFRCIPQVHGASKDVLRYVRTVFETEISGVTDNPNVFPEEDKVISAGNFHGQPLAMALDYLGIALSELGSISERRSYFLTSGQRDLPAFLVAKPGLNSGFMIPQYTAASMVSQNKQLATPASVDTIDSSNRQEDHVSMGANAATKTMRILKNLQRILSIELLMSAQALEFRRPLKSSDAIERIYADFRSEVSFSEVDEEMHVKMRKAEDFLRGFQV